MCTLALQDGDAPRIHMSKFALSMTLYRSAQHTLVKPGSLRDAQSEVEKLASPDGVRSEGSATASELDRTLSHDVMASCSVRHG